MTTSPSEVRLGSIASIERSQRYVGFTPDSGRVVAAQRNVAKGQMQTCDLSFALGQRLCDFSCLVDEYPREGAERAVPQGNGSDRRTRDWQFDRQGPDPRALGGKFQYGRWKNRKKTTKRQETYPYLGREANTVARGKSSPLLRKASIATDASELSGGGSTQGSFTRSESSILRRRAH